MYTQWQNEFSFGLPNFEISMKIQTFLYQPAHMQERRLERDNCLRHAYIYYNGGASPSQKDVYKTIEKLLENDQKHFIHPGRQ